LTAFDKVNQVSRRFEIMDKRTLLFVACVSLAFFGIHAWFGGQNSPPKIEQPAAKEEAISPIAKRKAPLSDLPLAAVFSDEESEKALGYGALAKNAILMLAWTQPLPSTLYVPELGTLELKTPSNRIGEPVIYAKAPFNSLETPVIPDAADLQLVTPTLSPRVVVGLRHGSDFATPYETLNENALVFLNGSQGYVPVGVFDSASQQIRQLNDFEALRPIVQQIRGSSSSLNLNEELYVLENDYQQLVFSTRGGSLAEINLPLHTGKDSKSLVKEIEADRLILKQSPANARFPLRPAHFYNEKGIKEGLQGGYYPFLRRSIVNPDNTAPHQLDPQYYALNLVGPDADLSRLEYKMTRFEKNLIQFEASSSQRRIVKTFTIPEEKNGPYCFELRMQIDGDARDLYLSSGVPEAELISGSFAPLLRYQVTRANTSDVETLSLSDKNPVTVVTSISPNWISNSNGFLGLIMDPLDDTAPGYRASKIPGSAVPTRLSVIDAAYQLYPADKYPGYATYLPLKSGVKQTFRIFAGPFDDTILKELDELYDDPLNGYSPEYSSAQSIQGWFSFISQPFAKFLNFLMQFFYMITHSWGFSIILLTIALRLMMYPLNNWSIKSTIRMQEIAPKVKAIQDRFKKDPKKGQVEVMNLYREQGINPFSGCFPVLLQMPFLIGMFYLLKSSFPLRGAAFIPGWIDNLAAPDVLFSWSYPILFIGTEFHLLPILLGLSMFWQQRMTSKIPKDTKDLSDTQKQTKMMGNLMSIIFTVMFYGFPSGLNIYFLSSTLLGLLQQWYIGKQLKETPTLVVKK
jgi:YidC/Oxa1 family membrane protein insertase